MSPAAMSSGPDGTSRRALESPTYGKIGARCQDLFGPAPASGFESFNEFVGLIHAGLSDPRLMPTRFMAGQNESVPAEGGFAVPAEYASQLLDASLEKEIVRPRAWITPMASATKKIAMFKMSDNSGDAPFGGP